MSYYSIQVHQSFTLCSGAQNIMVITDIRWVFWGKALHILYTWFCPRACAGVFVCVCVCVLALQVHIWTRLWESERRQPLWASDGVFSHSQSKLNPHEGNWEQTSQLFSSKADSFEHFEQKCRNIMSKSATKIGHKRDMMMMPFTRSAPHLSCVLSCQPLWPMAHCDLHKMCFIKCVGTA